MMSGTVGRQVVTAAASSRTGLHVDGVSEAKVNWYFVLAIRAAPGLPKCLHCV